MLYDPKWKKEVEVSPTKQILIEARKLIDREEMWGKGYSNQRPGKFCVGHAICIAAGAGYYLTASTAFRAANGKIGAISSWNDAPERTHAEVLAAFDRAIAST